MRELLELIEHERRSMSNIASNLKKTLSATRSMMRRARDDGWVGISVVNGTYYYFLTREGWYALQDLRRSGVGTPSVC